MATLGAAVAVTAKASELLPIVGFVPWARYGAWAGLLAGVLGLFTLVAAFRARKRFGLPGSPLLGFVLTGLAAARPEFVPVGLGTGAILIRTRETVSE